ncbi:MAG: NAD-dependent epimerase/dehydratase family protein [Clostridia bacterium]|nr:NAD-dependent epimerase/dehydratase family protein [Clostridia bacterium]
MNDSIIKKDMEEIYANGIDYSIFNNKTIIITGAYGMITSYLVKFFLFINQLGIKIKIIALIRNKEKFYKRFPECKGMNNVIMQETDLSEKINIEDKVNYLIHAASFASPDYYNSCPVEVIKPNVLGTMNLLEFAKTNLNNEGCFIFFSAGNVYGTCDSNKQITEETFGGLDPLHIYNCYCESKRMGETLCKAYSVEHNIKFKSLRIWHTYSPYMNIDKDPRVFASFVKNIRDNENIVIHSDGLGMRSFCYITDAISMMLYVILFGNTDEAYNICNTKEYVSIRELANTIVNLRPNKKLKVVYEQRKDNESYVENVVLKNVKSSPSNAKVIELGFKPIITIKKGFDRILKYLEI